MSSITPLTRFGAVPTVTILVGKDKTPFQVHHDQLCEASAFFKAAFEGQFRESSEKTMNLPEEDEHLFDLFVHWLYRGHYEIPPKGTEAPAERFMELVKLYVLAERYDVVDLRSLLITKLFEMYKVPNGILPGMVTVAYAYEHVSRTSGLRRLLADWYTEKVGFSWFNSEVAQEWFREHPEVAAAVISSFATTISRVTQTSPFDGEMPERYREAV